MSRILVIGATGGVGRAVASHLRSQGHTPLLAARTEPALRELAAALDAPFRAADTHDAGQTDGLLAWAADEAAQGGPLEGVVHAVGSILLKPVHRTSDGDWAETHPLRHAGQLSPRLRFRDGADRIRVRCRPGLYRGLPRPEGRSGDAPRRSPCG
jgi:NAD(P)-dependent dehydrogenase (short-subunit alcohol dehydrogenase family)